MRKTVLYIGMSLDGYIADPNGGVGWMNGQEESAENGDSYENFLKTVDTVIMGWNTYHQIATELSVGEWVSEGLTTWVITHRTAEEGEKATESPVLFTDRSPCDLVKEDVYKRQDIAMMKKAGINVIRIAESTWSSEEPEEGVFDFSHVTRVLEACEKAGISVIVGTPTYAIPAWMAKAYPEVMVTDRSGRRPYEMCIRDRSQVYNFLIVCAVTQETGNPEENRPISTLSDL